MRPPTQQAVIDERRQRVARLYLIGRTQWQIAEEAGCSQSLVSRDLRAIREAWRKSATIDFDEARAKELAKLEEVEREAWDAWQRSKNDAVTYRIKQTNDGEEKTVTRVGQTGNVRFLDMVQKCIAQRRTLLGLDAPSRSELRLSDDNASGLASRLTDDDLIRIATASAGPEAAKKLREIAAGDGTGSHHRIAPPPQGEG